MVVDGFGGWDGRAGGVQNGMAALHTTLLLVVPERADVGARAWPTVGSCGVYETSSRNTRLFSGV